jgi:hypothetical protein
VAYGAKLDLPAGGFDKPEYLCYRAEIVGLGERWSADIGLELDTVPIIGREILKIISRGTNPELAGLLVADIGRCHPLDEFCRTSGSGTSS